LLHGEFRFGSSDRALKLGGDYTELWDKFMNNYLEMTWREMIITEFAWSNRENQLKKTCQDSMWK